MTIFYSTLGQTIYLFLLILIGFVLTKLNILPADTAKILAKLENWIFIPALMLKTFMDDFTVDRLAQSGSVFLFSSALLVIIVPMAILISKLLIKDHFTQNIFIYGLAFSNFGYVGISVVEAVFPQYASDYLVFIMPLYILIYLWGVPCLLMKEEKTSFVQNLKSFLNPMFIGMFIGMIIGLVTSAMPAVTLPEPLLPPMNAINNVITALKSCMSPVAMLLTGVTVANINFKKTFTNVKIYAVTAVRLLAIPLVFLAAFKLIPVMPETFFVCTIASLAMPLGLNTIVIPSAYGKDVSVAAGMALVSHLISCATIPLVFLLL